MPIERKSAAIMITDIAGYTEAIVEEWEKIEILIDHI